MPSLSASVKGKDLGHLLIIAELWGIELNEEKNQKSIEKDLLTGIQQPGKFTEMVSSLPPESRGALFDLAAHQGRLPWSLFTKRYGEVREMGAARRDREQPYLDHNAAVSETLWYRALVGRAFFDTPAGPVEYAYIPEDMLQQMPPQNLTLEPQLGRPASKAECAAVLKSNDAILDDLCSLLAGLRTGIDSGEISGVLRASFEHTGINAQAYVEILTDMLSACGLIDENQLPLPKETRAFLEAGRGKAILEIFSTWAESHRFNELLQLPGLRHEGEWLNDPYLARRKVFDFLSEIPGFPGKGDTRAASTWWSLRSLVEDIQKYQPDFQRPSGDYDSWYIRDEKSGDFLRGFENWDVVDGMLVRYIVSGPMFWSGFVDLAHSGEALPSNLQDVSAFRFSARSKSLWAGDSPEGSPEENENLVIRSDARLHAPDGTSRPLRYQAARFCSWEGYHKGRYNYRITPHSLERAAQQGLTMDHFFTLLNRFDCEIPPNLVKALRGFESHGVQASIARKFVLRVRNPEILKELRQTRAARFLGDPLGPTAVEINTSDLSKIENALVELGYISEIKLEENSERIG